MTNDGSPADAALATQFATKAGAALLGAMAPVNAVEGFLEAAAGRHGVVATFSVLPDQILAVRPDGGTVLEHVPGAFRYDQTDRLFALIDDASDGRVGPREGLSRLGDIVALRPAFGPAMRFVGYLLLAVGLCLRLQPAWRDVAATAALAVVVAGLALAAPALRRLAFLVPIMVAFAVGAAAFELALHGWVADPTQVIVPLLAVFIPGALLAIGSLELTRGAVQAGAARLIAGIHQLLLLAFGLVLAASLTGTPDPGELAVAHSQVGWPVSVLGVGLYAVGAGLAFSAPPGALTGLAAVVYISWAVQQFTSSVVSNYAGAFLGAALGVVAAQLIHLRWRGPAALLTLNPLFRILAPGGLGLLGVTRLTAGHEVGADVGAVLFTFIAVAIGLVTGFVAVDQIRLKFRTPATSTDR
jgi:uncharacterized membrane protein YjjP (DUF1212 family)